MTNREARHFDHLGCIGSHVKADHDTGVIVDNLRSFQIEHTPRDFVITLSKVCPAKETVSIKIGAYMDVELWSAEASNKFKIGLRDPIFIQPNILSLDDGGNSIYVCDCG
ncbi:hypothetical protein OUZ56_000822 [Daphnia magna]|uniref:Uncharacterized protein n=1 Tax=Daphnia magna TaxID=35525 RepID=A0ABR0A0V9_9CRUS|nr:hypothetical protein OUZ56_000822 [Daphnia magna]